MSAPKRTFGLLDAALVAAGVIGAGYLVVRVLDVHRHTCCGCGRRWTHAGAMLSDRAASHACPNCGVEQWWRDGEATPEQRRAYELAHGAAPAALAAQGKQRAA